MFLALLFICLGGGIANAQTWQFSYGSTCDEMAFRGVQPVSTGGYIATGLSRSATGICGLGGRTDIYTVKMNNNGTQAWAFTYNISGASNDTAHCIRECANGDFILTGATGNAGCSASVPATFLMRINSAGAVLWCKTISAVSVFGETLFQEGYSVIETTTGDGVVTHAGDLVLCGAGYHDGNAQDLDGFIIRTDANGNFIWHRWYNNPLSREWNSLLSVHECTVGLAPGAPGDIIASGWSQVSLGVNDFYLVRVSGQNGLFWGLPFNHAMVQWGTPGNDVLADAQELKVGADAGNIVVSGMITLTGTMGGGGGNRLEAYVAKLKPRPSNGILAQRSYGGNDIPDDKASTIREVQTGTVGMTAGNLIFAGMTHMTGGFGVTDYFAVELEPVNLTIATGTPHIGFTVYGDLDSELCASAAVVGDGLGRTAGIILAGTTRSPGLMPAGDPQEMYIVKADNVGASTCHYRALTPQSFALGLKANGVAGYTDSNFVSCDQTVNTTQPVWPYQICGTGTGVGKLTSGSDAGSDDISAMENGSAVGTYPNPVRTGDEFSLHYTLANAGSVDITITDINGKVVRTLSRQYPAGAVEIPIGTQRWGSGAYFVKVQASGSTATKQIIVIDK